jgi:hypothetical protein
LHSPPTVSNSFVVLPDLHCPFQNDKFIDKVVGVASAWGIKDCVIAGDLLDLEPYSNFIFDHSRIVEEGLEAAEKTLDGLLDHFDNIKWIMGNHEERLLKKIGKNQISFDRLKRLVSTSPRVEFSQYYWAVGGDWIVCHPAEFSSSNPIQVATTMATKYNKNIIAAHMHIVAEGQDITGKYVGVVAGTCANYEELDYCHMRLNKKPEMMNGAVIVREGYHWLLTRWSDWAGIKRVYGR